MLKLNCSLTRVFEIFDQSSTMSLGRTTLYLSMKTNYLVLNSVLPILTTKISFDTDFTWNQFSYCHLNKFIHFLIGLMKFDISLIFGCKEIYEFFCHSYLREIKFSEMQSLKNWHLDSFTDFQSISALTKCKKFLKPNFRGSKTVKKADFDTTDWQKLISRKFYLAGKLPNFLTVGCIIGNTAMQNAKYKV